MFKSDAGFDLDEFLLTSHPFLSYWSWHANNTLTFTSRGNNILFYIVHMKVIHFIRLGDTCLNLMLGLTLTNSY